MPNSTYHYHLGLAAQLVKLWMGASSSISGSSFLPGLRIDRSTLTNKSMRVKLPCCLRTGKQSNYRPVPWAGADAEGGQSGPWPPLNFYDLLYIMFLLFSIFKNEDLDMLN
jgi:hypothetical protein